MQEILLFLISSLALTLMPGPDILFVINQSLDNRKNGIITSLGLCTGLIFHTMFLAFGREDLIPDMFMPLLEGINSKNNELNKLIYYFKRHIEVDGDMHGPMSMEMLTYLCKNDEEKISEAKSISEKALLSRISLWDGIENEIKTKYKYYEKV